MSVEITIEYPAGHSRTEKWSPTELFCPFCGKRNVWAEDGDGDYYTGVEYICLDCSCSHSQQGPWAQNVYRDEKILKTLRASDATQNKERA